MASDARGFGAYMLDSGLIWVVVGFAILISLNLVTLAIGPSEILQSLNSRSWGDLVSVFVFDSWGTAAGLGGVVVLFTPLLFGIPRARRFGLSVFFFFGSLVSGVIANVYWSYFYNRGGLIGAGSSSIDISGQGIIFALSIIGLGRLWLTRKDTGTKPGAIAREWRQFFLVVYVTLILSTLYFVVVLQPIYIPTQLYNWRVHEIAFALSIAATAVFVGVTWRRPLASQNSDAASSSTASHGT